MGNKSPNTTSMNRSVLLHWLIAHCMFANAMYIRTYAVGLVHVSPVHIVMYSAWVQWVWTLVMSPVCWESSVRLHGSPPNPFHISVKWKAEKMQKKLDCMKSILGVICSVRSVNNIQS